MGLESKKDGFDWVIVDDSERSARITNGQASPPAHSSRREILHWAYQEVTELVRTRKVESAVLKKAEAGQSLRSAILERAEIDGVIQAALEAAGVRVVALPWISIAKALNHRNKSELLEAIAEDSRAAGIPKARHGSVASAVLASSGQ